MLNLRSSALTAAFALSALTGCDRGSQSSECENHDQCSEEHVCVIGTCVPQDEALAHFRAVADDRDPEAYTEALVRAETGAFYREVVASRAAGEDVAASFAETIACYFGEPDVPRARTSEHDHVTETVDVVEYGAVDTNSAVLLARGRRTTDSGSELFQRAVVVSRPDSTSDWLLLAETPVDDASCFPGELNLDE